MKFFTVFAALLSVAFGYQATWTLQQLDEAISNPATDPMLVPYLEQALNEMMAAIFDGQQVSAVSVSIPAVDLSSWTLPQLSAAIQNPTTDPALMPYLEQALNQMMEAMFTEVPVAVAPVVVPAMDISSWTLHELDVAISDPNTNPELMPYLEHALNQMMEALFSGQQVESVVVAIPAGLLPVETPAAPIQPIEIPMPPVAAPVPPVVAPVPPVAAPAAPTSPLVQIVVNVNQQAAPVAPSPIIAAEGPTPLPVMIVDEAENQETEIVPAPVGPVQVVDVSPVQVVDVSPVQVVDVSPVQVVDVNPIDILHPLPAVLPVIVGAPVIGPMV